MKPSCILIGVLCALLGRAAPLVRSVVVGVITITVLMSGWGAPASAQSISGEGADPGTATFVAIPRTFPDVDARVMVVREPGQDVIVLAPGEVTTDALFMALGVLDRMRSDQPDPTHGQIIPISGFSVERPPSARDLGRLEAVLTRLERQPETDLGTLGRGRLVAFRQGSGPR